MKVVFAGTPEFAASAPAAIHAAGFTIPLVLTQPDRPAGRGMQLHASAVKQFALAHGIEVLQPLSLRRDSKDPQRAAEAAAAHARLLALDYDVMVVAAYGLILPCETLAIAPCINIHASLLPRWRGAAPIHRAIEAGDAETGVTIMHMEEGLDTGPMLAIEKVAIASSDTTASLHDTLAALGARMIVQTLQQMANGQLTATLQPEAGVTYAAKIAKDEAKLDFSQPAEVLARKIRAFNPFPGAHGLVDAVAIKLWEAEVADLADLARNSASAAPGSVLRANAAEGILIACGSEALRVHTLQKPGGKRLPAEQFLKGHPLEGKQFS